VFIDGLQPMVIYLTLLSLLNCLHLYFNTHLGLKHATWYKVHQPDIQTIIHDTMVGKRESSVLAPTHKKATLTAQAGQ
jgi:hypothetical protein